MKKLFIVFLLLAASCGKPLPTLEGIDLKQWKDDKNGCHLYRWKTMKQLDTQKDKLLSLPEDEILKLLGRPDQNELYRRSEKFFKYFLEPGPICRRDSSETILSIRFNAVGLAKEVEVENKLTVDK